MADIKYGEEELTKLASDLLTDDRIMIKSITYVNHKPHPYMIGPNHVSYAADKHGGQLGIKTLKKVQCAHPGCTLEYDAHTADRVCFLQFKSDISEKDFKEQIKLVKDLFKDEVDGFAFVEGKGTII